MKAQARKTLLLVVNVDWFFLSHRLPIALEAARQGYDVHVAAALTGRQAELRAHGFTVHPLQLDRSSKRVGAALRTLSQFVQLFRAVRPDVVHLVTVKPILLGGIAARLAGVPCALAAVSGLGFVFLARGFKAGLARRVVTVLYRLALGKRNVKVVFQNPQDCASLARLVGLPSHKCVLIKGSGVDLSAYRETPLPAGEAVVVLAARLLADKGVREFVEAARLLRGQGARARFCLVGAPDPGNPSSVTQTEVDRWRAEAVVEIWGHRDDMPRVLSCAHVVVLPSYREGLPKVLVEAAACGRATVTTDVPGCREAIDPGVTGLLVPARDATALAAAIRQLIEDRPLCAAMGKAGRRLAEREFSLTEVVAAHMKLYRQLLDEA